MTGLGQGKFKILLSSMRTAPLRYNCYLTMKKNCPGLLQFLLTCNADCHSQQQLLPVHEKELASCTSMCDGIGTYCKFKILLSSMRNATLRYNCYLTMTNNWLGVCVAGSGPAARHSRPSQGNTIGAQTTHTFNLTLTVHKYYI